MIKNYKFRSLRLKYPDLENTVDYYITNEGKDNEIFEWYTDKYPKPTEEEMIQWYNQYKYLEERRYPPVTEQLELLFDELKETGTISKEGDWYKAVQSVKDTYPKGE